MSTELKPINIYGIEGPNPTKVLIVLLHLGLPHEIINIPIKDVKNPDYVAINPNGRLPTIQDPNTNLTLWESGAIIEYLIERYDTKHNFSFPVGTPEYYHSKQWLFYQTTGQGPYYGQAVWFKKYHPEQLESAKDRYNKEINRVTGVLESWLTQQEKEHAGVAGFDGPWLVGNKMTFADTSFITFQIILGGMSEKKDFDVDDYPRVKDWLSRMSLRPAVKNGLDSMWAAFAAEQSNK
jgi:glutathione S-transferase